MRTAHLVTGIVRSACLLLAVALVGGFTSAQRLHANESTADWPSSGHDIFNTGHDPAEATISAANVGLLGVKWAHGPVAVVGTPVIMDGVVYMADAFGVVHARNADDGSPLWVTAVGTGKVDPVLGLAVHGAPVVTSDALFVGDSAATVHKLDRATGALLWSVQLDEDPNALIQGDPIVHDGLVMVGISSFQADSIEPPTFRGQVAAIDQESGEIEWRAYTTSDQTLETPKYGAGVGVWSSPAIDPINDWLYIGTGQFYEPGSQVPGPKSRGDRDYSDSLIVIDIHSGKIIKSRQFTAGDIWSGLFPDGLDYDVGIPPNLFSIEIHKGLGQRDFVGIGDKEGTYYVLDRHSLQPIWSRKISQGSVVGGFQSTAAFVDGVIYVAAHELFDGRSLNDLAPPGRAAQFYFSEAGVFVLQNLSRTNLRAIDAATGNVIWKQEVVGGATFAPLIVANGVVYWADIGGRVRALDARTGEELFFDEITITLPVPGVPGAFVEVPQVVTAMSFSDGQLFVAHGVPIPGFNPGGVSVYGLPEP
ncbi:MAG: PQQ-binding-like beta-propeller repeat protein [Vicinamibacterales bacterium]